MAAPRLTRRAALGGLLAAVAAPARAGARPRVVSLDDAITETLVALGHPPVAAPDTPSWTRWVVEPPLPSTVINLGAEQEANLDLMAALAPDLVLYTSYLDGDAAALARVAPCRRIAMSGPGRDGPLARVVLGTREIAELIGMPAAGEALVAETDRRFSHDATRLQARRARPVLPLSLLDGRHLRAFGTGSLWGNVLDRIGLRGAWTAPTNDWGFSTTGVETLAGLSEATLAIVDPMPPDARATLDASPLWRALPAVRAGRVLHLPVVMAFGALPAATRFSRLLADALDEATFD